MNGVLHQIVFQWSDRPLIGHAGVGPVAASLGGDDLAQWTHALALRITMASTATAAEGLAYLSYGSAAVVLHKIRARDDKGRPGAAVAHALLGPTELLDVDLALGLADWSGWAGDDPLDGRLPTVSLDTLADTVAAARVRQRQAAQGLGQRLDRLVADVLEDPAAAYTVVDPAAYPVVDPGLPAVALVRGMIDMIGSPPGAEWTFTTHEPNDTTPGLPKLVFLEQIAATGYGATRRRLTLDGAWPAATGAFANALAERYRQGGAAAVEQIRGERQIRTAYDVQWWIQAAFPGGFIMDGSLLDSTTAGSLSTNQADFLATNEGVQAIRAELDGRTDEQLGLLLGAWSAGSAPAQRFPRAAAVIQGLAVRRYLANSGVDPELTRAVRGCAPSVQLVERQLETLAQREPGDRGSADRLVEAVHRAQVLGVAESSPTIHTVLGRLTVAELFLQVNMNVVGRRTELAELLLGIAVNRPYDDRFRAAAREALEQTEYLIGAVRVLVPNSQQAADRLRQILLTAYGPGLGKDRDAVHAIIDYMARAESPEVWPAFGYALRGIVRDRVLQAEVDQIAARDRYLSAGLGDIWAAAPVPAHQRGTPSLGLLTRQQPASPLTRQQPAPTGSSERTTVVQALPASVPAVGSAPPLRPAPKRSWLSGLRWPRRSRAARQPGQPNRRRSYRDAVPTPAFLVILLFALFVVGFLIFLIFSRDTAQDQQHGPRPGTSTEVTSQAPTQGSSRTSDQGVGN